jgi:hypothetical protein
MFNSLKDQVKEAVEAFTGRKVRAIQPYTCVFGSAGINIENQDLNVLFWGKMSYSVVIPATTQINARAFYVLPNGTSSYVFQSREAAGANQESYFLNLETIMFTSFIPDSGFGTFSGYRVNFE